MKTIVALVAVFCACCQTAHAALLSPQVHDAANRARAIGREQDRKKALSFLDEIQSIEDWSLPGGIGPDDKVYVANLALVLFKPLLKWDTAEASTIVPTSNSDSQKWLSSDPKSEPVMLAMLSNNSAIARRIAFDKIRNSGSTSSAILSEIRAMAENDDYIIISIRPVGAGNPKDKILRAFTAPLRSDAIELLQAVGERDVNLNEDKLAVDGLAWLGKEFEKRVSDRAFIMQALKRLGPATSAIVDAKRRADEAFTPEQQLSLFRSFLQVKRSAKVGRQVPKN